MSFTCFDGNANQPAAHDSMTIDNIVISVIALRPASSQLTRNRCDAGEESATLKFFY